MLLAALFLLIPIGVQGWPGPQSLGPSGPWRSVGNHRFVITIPSDTSPKLAYAATIRWSRSDAHPELKGTVLLDAELDLPVPRCMRKNVTQHQADFVFSGVPGGSYHLYYMPFETCEFLGGSCQFGQTDGPDAMVNYSAFLDTCRDAKWWSSESDIGESLVADAPEARSTFDLFGPMEQAASREQLEEALRTNSGMLLVTEDRASPIRMLDQIPLSWILRSRHSRLRFKGLAQPGEAFSFQVGLVSADDMEVRRAGTDALRGTGGSIPGSALSCLNLEGYDFWGRRFSRVVTAKSTSVVPFWFVLQVPLDAAAGSYTGTLHFETSKGTQEIALEIIVRGQPLQDAGDSDLWRGSRLAWLDSTYGLGDAIPAPYVPLQISGRTISMLDKDFELSPDGMPSSIRVGEVETLASAVQVQVLVAGVMQPVPMSMNFTTMGNLTVTWRSSGSAEGLQLDVSGSVDATGYADFEVNVTCASAHEVRLIVPSRPPNADYAAGLGHDGGLLRRFFRGLTGAPFLWKWDGVNQNNAIWVGSSRAGLRLRPRGHEPEWLAAVPLDSLQAPPTPASWSNSGAGGIELWPNGTLVTFTGVRAAGSQSYLFSLLATPVRPVNLPAHFASRYAQIANVPNLTELHLGGATVVNVHQGNILNPWINYPYLSNGLLRGLADECHSLGMKLKVYNTMRELSNRALEIWALRALNETYVWEDGDPGGGDWLREHLRFGYSVAWANPMESVGFWTDKIDMAIRVKALSRWNNYYVKGLKQIRHDYNCGGIYLDEIAYDRLTMKRARVALGADGLIDAHSDKGGFMKVPAIGYTEEFPFIDSLWYGEGFDYDNASPDHWLVEISGLPFGLTSDMLRYHGDTPFHFRGMLFASADRWQSKSMPGDSGSGEPDPFDPRGVWALWDSFGISDSTMHGWWQAEETEGSPIPVQTNHPDVKCTTYIQKESALIVLANFGKVNVTVHLAYNWTFFSSAFRPAEFRLRAPQVPPMQPQEQCWTLTDGVSVPAPLTGSPHSREGWFLLLEAGTVSSTDQGWQSGEGRRCEQDSLMPAKLVI